MADQSFAIALLGTGNPLPDHNWSIPEFQRGFVWKAIHVRYLAESLWCDLRLLQFLRQTDR